MIMNDDSIIVTNVVISMNDDCSIQIEYQCTTLIEKGTNYMMGLWLFVVYGCHLCTSVGMSKSTYVGIMQYSNKLV